MSSIGFPWDPVNDTWNTKFKELENFYSVNKSFDIPMGEEWGSLNSFSRNLRKFPHRLNDVQLSELKRIGFSFTKNINDERWERNFSALSSFIEKNGLSSLKNNITSEDGIPIGSWLANVKTSFHLLSEEKIQRFKSLGISVKDVDEYFY